MVVEMPDPKVGDSTTLQVINSEKRTRKEVLQRT